METGKIQRLGIDIKVAFTVYARRLSETGDKRGIVASFISSRLFIKIKVCLRPLAVQVYYFLLNNSLCRPFAIKLRHMIMRYFNALEEK